MFRVVMKVSLYLLCDDEQEFPKAASVFTWALLLSSLHLSLITDVDLSSYAVWVFFYHTNPQLQLPSQMLFNSCPCQPLSPLMSHFASSAPPALDCFSICSFHGIFLHIFITCSFVHVLLWPLPISNGSNAQSALPIFSCLPKLLFIQHHFYSSMQLTIKYLMDVQKLIWCDNKPKESYVTK